MPKPDPRVIKRYANRKLYDTVTRQFTTLSELAVLIEGGTPLLVTDHDTGADLTDDVLAQVLGRRLRGAGGNTDALTGLLRGSTDAALTLTSGLLGGLAEPAPKQSKSGKKSAKAGGAKSAGAKAPKKAPKRTSVDDASEETPEQREIRELRAQVSELTAAVNLLVQRQAAE